MSTQTLNLTPAVYDYLLSVSLRETPLQQQLREETAKDSMAVMQISPEQGQFMELLVQLINAKRIIEVGTFTGYSALSMAQAMSAEAQIVCCDISQTWTTIAQRYWQAAGVADRIQLHIAPALKTLNRLLEEDKPGSYDMAFIDADKGNYLQYYECCLQLLRPGGLLLIDNTLWGGSVADSHDQTTDTLAIREFNQALHADQRVNISLLPLGDGLTLAVKCH